MIQADRSPAPRDTLDVLRAHRGMMVYQPDQQNFVKYAVALGTPTPQGFIPLEKSIGVMSTGAIFLKGEGPIQAGYYLITKRDLYRRRIDARPSRKLTLELASAALGAPIPVQSGDTGVAGRGQPPASGSIEAQECDAADLAFKHQVEAIQHAEDPQADFL